MTCKSTLALETPGQRPAQRQTTSPHRMPCFKPMPIPDLSQESLWASTEVMLTQLWLVRKRETRNRRHFDTPQQKNEPPSRRCRRPCVRSPSPHTISSECGRGGLLRGFVPEPWVRHGLPPHAPLPSKGVKLGRSIVCGTLPPSLPLRAVAGAALRERLPNHLRSIMWVHSSVASAHCPPPPSCCTCSAHRHASLSGSSGMRG
jgi:hypothetical protein